MGTMVLTVNSAGRLEANAGVSWSEVEVFDGARNQLRFALFGSGSVLPMEVQGNGVTGAVLTEPSMHNPARNKEALSKRFKCAPLVWLLQHCLLRSSPARVMVPLRRLPQWLRWKFPRARNP